MIRGRKTGVDCVVELSDEGCVTPLSLEKSLQVVDHSPDGFQWGYTGSSPAQLAAAILNEVTGAPNSHGNTTNSLSSTTYPIGEFEINEFQVRDWLRSVEAVQASVVDKAKKEFKKFHQLYERANHEWEIATKYRHIAPTGLRSAASEFIFLRVAFVAIMRRKHTKCG